MYDHNTGSASLRLFGDTTCKIDVEMEMNTAKYANDMMQRTKVANLASVKKICRICTPNTPATKPAMPSPNRIEMSWSCRPPNAMTPMTTATVIASPAMT